MFKPVFFLSGVVALLMVGLPAGAHHSHAMFDTSKRVTVTGTVEKFEFTNPHSWLRVNNASDGALWSFETLSPSQLVRMGVKVSSFAPGSKVVVQAAPLRDGRAGGQIISVTREDGSVVALAPEGGGPGPTQ